MSVTPGIYRLLGCAVIAVSAAALTPTASYAARSVDVALPDTRVTLRENAADPLKITSYTLGNVAYLRRNTGFVKQNGYQEITVAPKGAMALAVPTSYSAGRDSVLLADLVTNKAGKVETVAKPYIAKFAHWSRSGGKAVLTVQRKNGTVWETTGFVIVDATAKTARTVTVQGWTGPRGSAGAPTAPMWWPTTRGAPVSTARTVRSGARWPRRGSRPAERTSSRPPEAPS